MELHEKETPLSHIKKCELYKGNAPEQLSQYLSENPETIVALAYFDMDVYKPTKECLSFFGKLSPLIYDALFIDVVFRMHNATFECDDDKLVNRWLKVLFCIENSYT